MVGNADLQSRKRFIAPVLIFLGTFCLGLLTLMSDPFVITEDNLIWYVEAKIIVARQGIPYYNWYHTPLYQYLIAIVDVLFGGNLFALRLIQIICLATSACIIYATVNLKHERKVAILAAFFYGTSYTGLHAASDIHQEGLVVLFIALMFYFLIRYEKERNKWWLWLGTGALGAAFFTKEEALLVIVIYFIFVIFWLKPKMTDLMISAFILLLFVGPFMIVEYLQDWFMFRTYLNSGTFPGSIFDLSHVLSGVELQLIPILFSLIYIGVSIVNLIRKKKINGLHVMGFTILFYLEVYNLSRGYQIHLSYIIFEWSYLGSLGVFWLVDILKAKSKQFSSLMNSNPRKAIAVVLLPICVINLAIFIPNVGLIRNRNHNRIVVYQDIASIVKQNATYSQFRDALGVYIPNYYSDYSWYNSYQRHGFLSWSPDEVFVLNSFLNITDKNLDYFITEDGVAMSQFFTEIASNGTLTLNKTYTFTTQEVWWIAPVDHTIKLYAY